MVTPVNPPPPWCRVTGKWMLPDAVGSVEQLSPIIPIATQDGQPIANIVRCEARVIANGRPLTISWVHTNADVQAVLANFPDEVDRRLREVMAPKIVGASGLPLGRG